MIEQARQVAEANRVRLAAANEDQGTESRSQNPQVAHKVVSTSLRYHFTEG
jgi:hypothetical protein